MSIQEKPMALVGRFVDSPVPKPTLGLVYGRRRIGKSTLLDAVAVEREGFRWEATRGEAAVHLTRLGEALGAYLGVGRLDFSDWRDAIEQLLRLGMERSNVPVVLDEFGYVLEADQSVDSIISSLLGPRGNEPLGTTRLILCGSAMAMMRALTAGNAPLRGRAGLELMMQPHDFRDAATWLGDGPDLELAIRVFSVVGGVIGYSTDMVDYDLPGTLGDVRRWISARVLSPASTLHHEATTLLAEDPTLAAASPTLYHSILGAIANGSVSAGTISNRLRRPIPNLDPAMKRLIAAGFVVRHVDPLRSQRPTYALADPFLQFHYAVLEPHGSLLRDRDVGAVWDSRLAHVFDARVRGPVFEELARTWVRRYATDDTIGGPVDHVGPSTAVHAGQSFQLDVVVARAGDLDDSPADRVVVAIGEAKAGELLTSEHLRKLDRARAALGARATGATLLLFGERVDATLKSEARGRTDVGIVDLDRLYYGD